MPPWPVAAALGRSAARRGAAGPHAVRSRRRARNAVGVAAPLAIGARWRRGRRRACASTIGALQTGLRRPARARTGCGCCACSARPLAAARHQRAWPSLLLAQRRSRRRCCCSCSASSPGCSLSGGPSATQVGRRGDRGRAHPRPPAAAAVASPCTSGCWCSPAAPGRRCWRSPRGRSAGTGPNGSRSPGCTASSPPLARRPPGTDGGPPLGDALAAVRADAVRARPRPRPERRGLPRAARRGRAHPPRAGRARRAGRAAGRPTERPVEAGLARAALGSCGAVLDGVGDALDDGPRRRPAAVLDPARDSVRRAVAPARGARRRPDPPRRRGPGARARRPAARRRSRRPAPARARDARPRAGRRAGRARLRDPIAALRANLSPDSAVLRHAVRAARARRRVGPRRAAARVPRGYWMPLTILVMLRPGLRDDLPALVDARRRHDRSACRSPPSCCIGSRAASGTASRWSACSSSACGWPARATSGCTAVSLSGLVVVLLSLDGVAPRDDPRRPRGGDTRSAARSPCSPRCCCRCGSAQRVPARLADLLAAYRDYLDVLADPGSDRRRAAACTRRRRGWRAPTRQASVERARAEPVVSRAAGRARRGGARALASLRARAADGRQHRAPPVALPELDDVLAASSRALAAVRDGGARRFGTTRASPRLRPVQEALHAALRADPDRVGGADAAGGARRRDRSPGQQHRHAGERDPSQSRRDRHGQDRYGRAVTAFDDLAEFVALPRLTGTRAQHRRHAPGRHRPATRREGRALGDALWEIPLDGGVGRAADALGEGRVGAGLPARRLAAVRLVPSRSGRPRTTRTRAALWLLPAPASRGCSSARPGGLGAPVVAREFRPSRRRRQPAPWSTDADDAERRRTRKDRKINAILHTGMPIRYWDHELGDESPRLLRARARRRARCATWRPTRRGELAEAAYSVSADGARRRDDWRVRRPGRAVAGAVARRRRRDRRPAACCSRGDDERRVRRPGDLARTGRASRRRANATGHVRRPVPRRAGHRRRSTAAAVTADLGDLYPNEWVWAPDSATL